MAFCLRTVVAVSMSAVFLTVTTALTSGSSTSSKSSGNSGYTSENSGENSNKNSNRSTDQSLIVTGVAVGIGLLVGISIYLTARKEVDPKTEEARLRDLKFYLAANHTALSRDLVAGKGIIFDDWADVFRLTKNEQRHYVEQLKKSQARLAMIAALDGEIDDNKARQFALALTQTFDKSFGSARLLQVATMLEKHMKRTAG